MKNLIDLVKTENVGAFRDAVKAELNRRFEKAYENIMGETIERMGMKYHEPSIEESFKVVDETVVDLDEACKDMKPEVEPSDEPSEKDKVEDEKDEVKDSMEESVKKEEDEDEESDDATKTTTNRIPKTMTKRTMTRTKMTKSLKSSRKRSNSSLSTI